MNIDRTIIRPLGRTRPIRHQSAHIWGGTLLICLWFWEMLIHIPRLLSMRFQLRKALSQSERVVVFSDNLDEINGIAINSRQVIHYLQSQGKAIDLMGIAFHNKAHGGVEACGTLLLPQVYSMDQVGYPESELAIPCVSSFLDWIQSNTPKIVEIETPSSGGMMIAMCAKILGIQVISHYRTDIFAYSDLLVKSKLLVKFIKTWVSLFNQWTAPIIVPSTYFIQKLQIESKLKEHQIKYLERGIPLQNFSPNKNKGLWNQFFPEAQDRTRFLYVGRVSKEKELDLLLDLWPSLPSSVELLVVGHGPFLQEMQARAAQWKNIQFSGKLSGDTLASIYAEGDYFIFPSGTDTFGNVVVEALASGTPALVSDWGGPRDIVSDESGWVIEFRSIQAWSQALQHCAQIHRLSPEYKQRSEACIERSKLFQIENAAMILWNFYQEILHARH